jgi:putative pyrroloquinoline-quinone binding quinoprotein
MIQLRARSVAFLLFLGFATATHAWVATVGPAGEDSVARGVAVDADGNVVAGGTIASADGDAFSAAAKFDGTTGDVLWGTSIRNGWATGFALDPFGNALVAGAYEDPGSFGYSSNDLLLARLQSADGAAAVQVGLSYGMQWFTTVEADGVGGVVAGGGSSRLGQYEPNFMVQKGFGTGWTTHVVPFVMDGLEGWGLAEDVAIDAAGDVLAVGYVKELVRRVFPDGASRIEYGPDHPIAVKLRGSDGAVVWQRLLDETGTLGSVVLDADGNPVVIGDVSAAVGAQYGEDLFVSKLDAATGDDLWRTTVDGGVGGVRDFALAAVLDAAGDVVVGGRLETELGSPVFGGGTIVFTVLKLAGADGVELWRHQVPNTVEDVGFFGGVKGEARGVALALDGSPVVAGVIDGSWIEAGPDGNEGEFLVAKLSGATGERVWTQSLGWGAANAIAVSPVHGFAAAGRTVSVDGETETERFTVVKFSDTIEGNQAELSAGSTPSGRRLSALSKDRDIHLPIRDSQGDPTLHGARLIVTHSGGVADAYDLPAGNWTRGRGRYSYKDNTGAGPCGRITLRTSRQLKVRCRGGDLNVPGTAMNEVGIRLELGPEKTTRYCMRFGGAAVVRDDPGAFAARLAPPPTGCDGD